MVKKEREETVVGESDCKLSSSPIISNDITNTQQLTEISKVVKQWSLFMTSGWWIKVLWVESPSLLRSLISPMKSLASNPLPNSMTNWEKIRLLWGAERGDGEITTIALYCHIWVFTWRQCVSCYRVHFRLWNNNLTFCTFRCIQEEGARESCRSHCQSPAYLNMLCTCSSGWVGLQDTQISILLGITQKSNVHSKYWWLVRPCNYITYHILLWSLSLWDPRHHCQNL